MARAKITSYRPLKVNAPLARSGRRRHGEYCSASDRRNTTDQPAGIQADAAAWPALSDRVYRPFEYQLRQAADAGQSRFERSGVWAWRVLVFHRLSDLRSAEQRAAAQVRRAALDRTHHADVGHCHGTARIHEKRHDVLRAALPARCFGSRALSRRDLLPDLVVSIAASGADAGVFHGGQQPGQHGGRAYLRLAAGQGWTLWSARLAARVHRHGHTVHSADRCRAVVFASVSAQSEIHVGCRKEMAGRYAR